MGVMVDLILIAILLAFMIIGYVRGLAGSLIKLASFAIAVVLAVMLYKPISNVIMEKTQIDEKIETTLKKNFSKEKVSAAEENIKTNYENYAHSAGVSFEEFLSNYMHQSESEYEKTVKKYAQKNVLLSYAYTIIADKEDIHPSDKEIEQEVNDGMKSGGYASKEAFLKEHSREEIRDYLTGNQVVKWLTKNCKQTTQNNTK